MFRGKLATRAGNYAAVRILTPIFTQQVAISQRQLERLYKTQVGMSPKHYARLMRIMAARLALKQKPAQSNTRLAIDLGFYDQAHFIREFTAVIGMTPYRYMQRSRLP